MKQLTNIILEDFFNRTNSKQYSSLISKCCEKESKFLEKLDNSLKKEYFEVEEFFSKYHEQEITELADYMVKLFLKKINNKMFENINKITKKPL